MSNEHHAVIVVSKKISTLSSKDSSDTSCLPPNKMFCHVFLNLEYDCELFYIHYFMHKGLSLPKLSSQDVVGCNFNQVDRLSNHLKEKSRQVKPGFTN